MKEKTKPKHKLILLGNGFDLAHGLPTSYEDFIFNYTKEEINDNFINSRANANNYFNLKFYNDKEFNVDTISNITTKANLIKIVQEYFIWKNHPFTFPTKLITIANGKNWADIESFFYKELIFESGLKKSQKQDVYTRNRNLDDVKKLNTEFENVKLALQYYLTEYVENQYIFKPKKEFINILKGNEDTESILLLNFNYTKTAEMYLPSLEKYNTQLINIHGKLNDDEGNPMIFGFGDEYDKLYKVIEEYNDKSLFQHIKSFGYVKTNNYSKMERFVETEPYEIFIIGHSCGLSDRTLLKYLFEHDNCTSIKIFYHEEDKGNFKKSRDNHNYTTQEISRHFEDKAKMRSRIINFKDSKPCPQTPLKKKKAL